MSPSHARPRTLYLLIFLNLVLAALLTALVVYVSQLRSDVEAVVSNSKSACLRGNLIRSQINYNSSVLRSFLSQAASTREQTAEKAERDGDKVTARINRDAAAAYRALEPGIVPLPLIACETIIP